MSTRSTASYFRASVTEFLETTESEIFAKLTLGYANSGFSQMKMDQPLTWWDDLSLLRTSLQKLRSKYPKSSNWQILLEFSIPRKQRRLDIVLLTGGEIILLECKRSASSPEAIRQVEEYALLLHYFHKPSHQQRIYPIVVSAATHQQSSFKQRELSFPTLPSFWIAPTAISSWSSLVEVLASIPQAQAPLPDGAAWEDGAYRPTPTIIDAALALRTGLKIRELPIQKPPSTTFKLLPKKSGTSLNELKWKKST